MNADKMNCVFVFCDEAECSIGLARVLPETSPSVEFGCFVIVTTCYGGPVACINMSRYRYKKCTSPKGDALCLSVFLSVTCFAVQKRLYCQVLL